MNPNALKQPTMRGAGGFATVPVPAPVSVPTPGPATASPFGQPQPTWMSAQEAERRFAQIMPGYDMRKAARTSRGYPYVLNTGADFEPGTFGQRLLEQPVVNISKRIKPTDLDRARKHEEEHVNQWYQGRDFDAGYNPRKERSRAILAGLDPDTADWWSYANAPSERAADAASGVIDPRFAEIEATIAAIEAKRKARR